jgi:hypothetical protein
MERVWGDSREVLNDKDAFLGSSQHCFPEKNADIEEVFV